MAYEFLEPTVTVVAILGFTFYLFHRLEDKIDTLTSDNTKDHGVVNNRLTKIEDRLNIEHEVVS